VVRPAVVGAEFVVEDGEQQQQLLDHRRALARAVAVVAQDLVDVGLRFLGAPEVLQALGDVGICSTVSGRSGRP
jgi:hypothetical protein